MSIAVIGADGQMGKLIVRELLNKGVNVTAISRQWKEKPFAGNVIYKTGDATNVGSLEQSLVRCDLAICVLGLPYDTAMWQKLWLPMVKNVMTACKKTGASLVYFDNVYSYGLVRGAMTEKTAYNPCSKKGIVRAAAATLLTKEMQNGSLPVMIVRSADFIGPHVATSIVGGRFFASIGTSGSRVRGAEWLGNPRTRHTYNFSIDNARAVALLATTGQDVWNQVWHLPALAPITGIELCGQIEQAMGVKIKLKPVHDWMLAVAGFFGNRLAREQNEMQYQVDNDYIFDDSKFMSAFPKFKKTPLASVIAQTVAYFSK